MRRTMFRQKFNDSSEGEGVHVSWVDMTLTLAFLFLTVLVIILIHVNPKSKKTTEASTKVIEHVIIDVTWPHDLDTDVDVWVQAPGDVPVGYSNKGGVSCNLLRDDLGKQGDLTNMNYETVRCRGILPGEYVVNLHLYRNNSIVSPIPVMVVVSTRSPKADNVQDTHATQVVKQVLATKPGDMNLERPGEELTVFRFQLTEDGEVVKDSVHSLFKQLRAASSGGGNYDYGNMP